MIDNVYILDCSGSMTGDMIKHGHKLINNLMLEDRLSHDTSAHATVVLEWSPLTGLLSWLIEDCRKAFPGSKIHLFGDEYALMEDQVNLVDYYTVIDYPSTHSEQIDFIGELDPV